MRASTYSPLPYPAQRWVLALAIWYSPAQFNLGGIPMRKRICAALTIAFSSVCWGSLADGYDLHVPSDPKAEYVVLEKTADGDGRTIVTKRSGGSGVTYSRRLYDCARSTVKYIGTGGSIEAMEASPPDRNMAPIVEGSIAYYVGIEACK